MTYRDTRAQGGPLLPTSEPRRSLDTQFDPSPYFIVGGKGTHENVSAANSLLSTWLTRQHQWHMGFQQKVGPRIARYWGIWRAFNQGPNPGPGQEWRDRTVIPQAFKELDTIVPKMIMGLWGDPRNYTVRGRGAQDAEYEEMVRQLLDLSLDEIGQGDPQSELFLKRMIDAEYYKQIMGHVWLKVFWRNETSWLKTKLPKFGEGSHRDNRDDRGRVGHLLAAANPAGHRPVREKALGYRARSHLPREPEGRERKVPRAIRERLVLEAGPV
jgi:hypothetical protein